MPRGEQPFGVRRDRLSLGLHASNRSLGATGIPKFKWTELPVESEAHSAIDLDDRICNLRNAVRRVVPNIAKSGPQKRTDLIGLVRFFIKSKQHSQSRADVFDILCRLQRGELRLLLRMVFECLPIQREAFFLVPRVGGRGRPPYILLVETAFGFVAEPFAVEHLLEKVGQHGAICLVTTELRHIAHYVTEDIESDKIDSSKCRRSRPADD